MHGEYIEERDGGYYVRGTRISLDSVVYSSNRGNSPESPNRIPAAEAGADLRSNRVLSGSQGRDR